MNGTDFGDTKEMGNKVLAHDRDGINATNNHKPAETTEPGKYEFAHDINNITAANNHGWANEDDSIKSTTEESKEMGNNVLAHDRDGINAANNHVEINDPESMGNLHQEALDSNTKANEGFNPLTPLSENGQDFFARSAQIAEDARKDAIHQEALDSNTKANEGFNPLTPLSENGQDFFTRSTQIVEDAKKDAMHQRALDSNTEANKGFNGVSLSQEGQNALEDITLISRDLTGKNFEKSLTEILDPESAKQFVEFLERDKLPFTPNPENIANNNDIEEKLEEMNAKLDEIKEKIDQLLNGQEISTLSNEQMIEYITLLEEQGQVQNNKNKEILKTVINNYTVNNNTIPTGTPTPTPVPTPTPAPSPTPTPAPTPTPTPTPGTDQTILELQDQLRELRGENTWEQRSADYARDLERLNAIQETRQLTIAEKAEYFDLQKQKEYIDQNVIAPIEQENQEKRNNKEKWIKIGAGILGAGVALATPAVGVAAIIAVALGGNLVGKGLKKWEGNLRSKSTSMKYESRLGKSLEQLNELDKKQKRNEWWANRLGEAAAVVTGGAIGYGLGKAVQNIFGMFKGAGVNTSTTTTEVTGNAQVGRVPIETQAPPQPIPQHIPTPTGSTGGVTEGWLGNGEWLDTSQFGWDPNQLGWRGSNIALSSNVGGSTYAPIQKDFFSELSKLVSKEQLMGQANAFKVNDFLRAAYNGTNPVEAAKSAAQALLGN